MIRAVIFDLWDTLLHPKDWNSIRIAQEILGRQDMPYEEFKRDFSSAFMTQKLSSFEEMCEYVCSQFGAENGKAKDLLLTWYEERKRVELYPETMEVLEALSRNYKIGLLSNASMYTEEVLKDTNLSGRFDTIVISYMVGMLKPDERIYREMLRRIGVNAEDAMMVGDNYVDDVEGPEKVGIRGILLDRSNKYPQYTNRISSLKQLEASLV